MPSRSGERSWRRAADCVPTICNCKRSSLSRLDAQRPLLAVPEIALAASQMGRAAKSSASHFAADKSAIQTLLVPFVVRWKKISALRFLDAGRAHRISATEKPFGCR